MRRRERRESTPQGAALAGAEVAVVANPAPAGVAALLAAPPPRILDLCGRLGPQVEALPGYEGVAW
jgi:GDP-mannose 6-dehydrogenase